MWTYKQPEQAGWYWVIYHGYEYVEPVYFTGHSINVAGIEGQTSTKQVLKWSTQPIVVPSAE